MAEYSEKILDFVESTERYSLIRLAIERRLAIRGTTDLEYLRAYLCILSNPHSSREIVDNLNESPDHPNIIPSKLTLRAECSIARGEYTHAESLLDLALNDEAQNWHPYSSYTKLRFSQNRLDGLDDFLDKAAQIFPKSKQISLLRIDLLIRLRRYDDAIGIGLDVIRALGDESRIYSAIACCLIAQGKADESIDYLVYALSLDAEDTYCYSTFGDALASLHNPIEAIRLYEKGLTLKKWSILYNSIGLQLGILQRHDLAIRAFSQGLEIDKNNNDIWINIASSLSVCGEPEAAISILETIYSRGNESWPVFCQIQFILSSQGESALAKSSRYGHQYWSKTCKVNSISTSKRILTARCKPLRIGFLSADIGDHVVGRFIMSILSGNSQSISVDIVSTQRRFEESSLRISRTATQAFSTQGLSAKDARALIKAKGYDIIVDTSGYTKGTGIGLLSDRCAPIQCHYIGYHASTYAPFIDYFITDQVLAPEGSDILFAESVYRLKRTWLALSAEYLPNIELIQPRTQVNQSITFGSFCQASKISDLTLEIWSRVLARVPHSSLLIKSINLTETLKERIIATLKRSQVIASRVQFIAVTDSYAEHMQLYNKIDIALDTAPWSSATTCFEALSMGVPLVAFTGNTLSARMSTSVVNGGGLASHAASNLEDYARICLSLSKEIQERRITKESIRNQVAASELYDNSDLLNHLSVAFFDMHARYLHS
ncbi:O-linked N-acetylglucosamine transferase, SPINDLY family protein [Synechococcus sp. BA-132 BA5]|uniref:O-linked N-acetylglucosamine transferase, SPINDLY family protein n=1 Tax=Synechococcus sp. BA-132 BA5 TaxID=3110252 RepID=UPI002B1F51EB|nr:hypothetical protein [Synechococcus sp. BA-132 BA5]MEA5417048.1 hypothetical protein [Synechococcus sp. BA-132 BA5]